MARNAEFITFAGNIEAWEAEIAEGVAQGEDLSRMQERQNARGRSIVELVRSLYGWTVRDAMGFTGRAIRYKATSFDDAVRWCREWVAADEDSREAFVRRSNLGYGMKQGDEVEQAQVTAFLEMYPASGRGKPFRVTVPLETRCVKCDGVIPPGEEAYWQEKVGISHIECPEPTPDSE